MSKSTAMVEVGKLLVVVYVQWYLQTKTLWEFETFFSII